VEQGGFGLMVMGLIEKKYPRLRFDPSHANSLNSGLQRYDAHYQNNNLL